MQPSKYVSRSQFLLQYLTALEDSGTVARAVPPAGTSNHLLNPSDSLRTAPAAQTK
jgi:hypothetical protein